MESDEEYIPASQPNKEEINEKAIEMEGASSSSHVGASDVNKKILELQKKLSMARKQQTSKTLDVNITVNIFHIFCEV